MLGADEAVDPGIDFLRLKESLGSLLLVWSRLEDALADALQRGIAAPPRIPVSFGERLAALRLRLASPAKGDLQSVPELVDLARRIDDVRRLRNLICHRLSGVCADPSRGEPHIVCSRGVGERRAQVRITQSRLSNLLADIDRCTRDLGRVGAGRR